MSTNRPRPESAATAGPSEETGQAAKSSAGLRFRLDLGRLWNRLTGRLSLVRLVEQNLRFSVFLTAIGLFYIWNAHAAEHRARKLDHLEEDLKALKSNYMTLNARLSDARKQSSIRREVDPRGLEPLEEAPYRLPSLTELNQLNASDHAAEPKHNPRR